MTTYDIKKHFIKKMCKSNVKITAPNKLISNSQKVYQSITDKEGSGDYGVSKGHRVDGSDDDVV
jgi:hypothetical protein